MHIVALGWAYVVLMMVLAEALGPGGSILGAITTLVLYGALPLSLVLYIGGARSRARARRLAEAASRGAPGSPSAPGALSACADAAPSPARNESSVSGGVDPGRRGEAASESVAPVREEP